MPSSPDLDQLKASSIHGFTTATVIDPTAETTVWTGTIPSGQMNTVGAVMSIRHYGTITNALDLVSGMDLVFRWKLGSDTLATATVWTGSGAWPAADPGTILVIGDAATVSDVTMECHVIGTAAAGTGAAAQFFVNGASMNTDVVACPSVSSGALTATLTVQWGADPTSKTGVYTARSTSLSFSNS